MGARLPWADRPSLSMRRATEADPAEEVGARLEIALELPDSGQMQTRCRNARRFFRLSLLAKSLQHRAAEPVERVFADGFSRRHLDEVSVADSQHTAAHGHVVLLVPMVAPSNDRYRQDSYEVGMARQNAEGAGFIFGAHMAYAFGIYNDRHRCGYQKFHAARGPEACSLARASSIVPTI